MKTPNLTKAGNIKNTKKRVKRQKILKPARIKEIDTGVKQIVEIVEGEGIDKKIRKEERPIMERVTLSPVFEEIEQEEEIYIIETEYNGEREAHEFNNRKDADQFKKGFE